MSSRHFLPSRVKSKEKVYTLEKKYEKSTSVNRNDES